MTLELQNYLLLGKIFRISTLFRRKTMKSKKNLDNFFKQKINPECSRLAVYGVQSRYTLLQGTRVGIIPNYWKKLRLFTLFRKNLNHAAKKIRILFFGKETPTMFLSWIRKLYPASVPIICVSQTEFKVSTIGSKKFSAENIFFPSKTLKKRFLPNYLLLKIQKSTHCRGEVS